MTLETYPRPKPLLYQVVMVRMLHCYLSIMLPWASYLTSIKTRICFWNWVVCTFEQDIPFKAAQYLKNEVRRRCQLLLTQTQMKGSQELMGSFIWFVFLMCGDGGATILCAIFLLLLSADLLGSYLLKIFWLTELKSLFFYTKSNCYFSL